MLITGASGLLGQALIREFWSRGIGVLAQFHRHQPSKLENVRWLYADFNTLSGIRGFLKVHGQELSDCTYLVNNYGPITDKELVEITSTDLLFDYHHNLIAAFEITKFLINHASMKSVVTLGFEGLGKIKPYRRVLSYAIAKNALYLMNQSLAQQYQHIHFNMVSPRGIEGAEVQSKTKNGLPPQKVAAKVYRVLTGGTSFKNYNV